MGEQWREDKVRALLTCRYPKGKRRSSLECSANHQFFRWLSERYPLTSQLITPNSIPTFDNL